MSVKQILMAATAATVLATSAVFAEGTGLMAKDAYARAATPECQGRRRIHDAHEPFGSGRHSD